MVNIEQKWQKKWADKKVFSVKKGKGKKKYYVLEMYPYPSSSGLHIGHVFNYTIGDIYSRFKIMQGFNVLHPMGFDSFGLPAENAAIKAKQHPKKYTEKSIQNFIKQQKTFGITYDWNRVIASHDPEYYKWNQYFFLKFFEKGLAYRKKAPVNWCRKCNTVLANEQVHNGKCWRHEDTDVEIKQLEQWFIKTTKYADELLRDVEKLDWPNRIKIMQRNWIGKSFGTEIKFKVNNKDWPIFTTRPDTIYGVTFMVISAQHPQLMDLVSAEQKKEVEKFLKRLRSVSEKDIDLLEKEGVFTGAYAINPVNNEKVPIYAGNFVVADYGSGMVMAVPAHDQRDFEFAKKYKLPIKEVIKGGNIKQRAYTGEGELVNSNKFNGVNSKQAIDKITEYLKKKKLGKKQVQYKLKDWLVSRQRYWGTPIPIVYCDKCGIVGVKETSLPVKLPEKVQFGKGNPLVSNKSFLNVKCPKCRGKARRETDTMDTFFDSSWYFLRYCDNKNKKKPFDRSKVQYWMPVDQYIGGAEHACMHLIYARFFTKALRDLKMLKFNEPFIKLFNQGMVHGEDGSVLSKSKGNYIDPLVLVKKYGVDVLRFYLVSSASPDKDFNWSDKSVQGSLRFLNKVVAYFKKYKSGKTSSRVESKLNNAIVGVTKDIENYDYNLAIIKLRELFESFEGSENKKDVEAFLKMLCVFCPHIAEELWEKIGNKQFISLAKWPVANKNKINKKFEQQEQIIDNLVRDIVNITKIIKGKISKVYVYVLPAEKQTYKDNELEIAKRVGLEVEIYAVNDKNKHDPENKSKKVKPGRPGIYIK